jgi:Leucine-rich repeat (LRR) protein
MRLCVTLILTVLLVLVAWTLLRSSGSNPERERREPVGAGTARLEGYFSLDEHGEIISAYTDPSDLADAEALLIAGPYVTDAELVHLERLANLRTLHFAAPARITGAGLVHLEGLADLRSLKLISERTDPGLEHLAGLTNLRSLYVFAPVTDTELEHLKGMTQLEELTLNGTKVTDAWLEHVKKMSGLKRLGLDLCSNVTDAGLKHMQGLTKLESLDLAGTGVTDAGVEELQRALPRAKIIRKVSW